MLYFQTWSGGKDSTASIILEHELDLRHPPSTVVMSEAMFDLKRNISGELPEHIEWVHTKAKPLLESWGHKVEIIRADKDFMDNFFFVITKGPRKGKLRGFPLGGRCNINRDIKSKAVHNYFKQYQKSGYIQYLGIAADEPERYERLKGTNKRSLLAEIGYTEQMAFELCQRYGLLSPVYDFTKRGGCWFCPNQKYKELARLKRLHCDLWDELEQLSHTENLVSYCFKYDLTFQEVAKHVDGEIENQLWNERQISIFDKE